MKTEKIKTMVVGKEAKTNKEGQPYGIISVMDGSQVLNLVTKDDKFYSSVEVFKPCEVVLNVTLGKYPKVDIVEFAHV